MEEQDVKAQIFYYCREMLYNHMLKACKDGTTSFRGDLSFNLYNSVALALSDNFSEALQEMEVLKAENDFRLSVAIMLMYTHRAMGSKEKEYFSNVDSQVLRDYRKNAGYIDLYNSAFVLFAFRKYEKAYDCIEKALNIELNAAELLCLKGWISLSLSKYNLREYDKISELFEMSLKDNKRYLDGALGLAESFTFEKKYDEALNVLNKAVVRFPSVNLALVHKMGLYFTLQDWEQCTEVMNRVLILDAGNLEALKIHILILIVNQAKYDDAAELIEKFIYHLNKTEPKNGILLVENAQLFSRICGRNKLILDKTYSMVEKALTISLNNLTYMTELGYQCFLQEKFKEAARIYKSVTKLDDSSVESLSGMTLCELLQNGKTDQIQQQVEFLVELQESNKSPLIMFMQATLADEPELSYKLLLEICQMQINSVRLFPYSAEYLIKLNPDLLLFLYKELLVYIPQSSQLILEDKQVRKSNVEVKALENILKIIVKACPGLQESLYLLAKTQFLNGDAAKAKNTLEQVLSNADTTFSEGYLLMAQIQIYLNQYDRAARNLEISLSSNFKIRDNPLYHFIEGIIEKSRNNVDEAIKCFTTALNIVDNTRSNSSLTNNSINKNLPVADKASIYFKLIDAHTEANQIHEATKLLASATEEFKGTAEETRIIIMNADQAVKNNDIQEAIDLLSKINSNDVYYLQAKTKLAKLLLEYRRDNKAYLSCYQELVDNDPGPESYLLLADAYIQILDVPKALESYEKALQYNPIDPYLCSKMGKAFIQTHHYTKAILYYQDAIKLTDESVLKLELADLYIKLKHFDKAEMLITSEIENETVKNLEDIPALKYKAKLMTLLANIFEKSGNVSGALKSLRMGRETQSRVIKRLTMEELDVSEDELKILKEMCLKQCELATMMKDNDGAVSYCKDALSYFSNDPLILTTLAKLYMTKGSLELCQQTCAVLLKIDPNNEYASVTMADIAFCKIDFDMASFHFTTLLSKQPTNWNALVRFIEVSRRMGELESIPQYLQQAEQSSEDTAKESGFFYCTAMYQWYTGNLNGALRNFNQARTDSEFGKKAICNMIEICLNPEDELLGERFLDGDDLEYRDSRTMALKTAERLLRELKQKGSSSEEDNFKYRLLGNFILLATKEKFNIEQALEEFTVLASQELYREEVGPILGLATAHNLLKQNQRAKNQLKRVAKTVWTFEDAEYLERCWLLLADYYIQSSKYDLASDLLKRVLQHNKTCTKAYEFSGYISEKEQSYKEAASYYDYAWRFGSKNNPTVGYKLAFNFMKCKKYAEAIDTCQQVLRNHPEYPRIKKDILEKSLNNLRT